MFGEHDHRILSVFEDIGPANISNYTQIVEIIEKGLERIEPVMLIE